MLLRRVTGLATVFFATGCASTASLPVAEVPIVASEPSADVDAFVGRFFADGPSSPSFGTELRQALAQHAASGSLHEVAGYWALLRGDDHGAWQHFLLAATDVHHAGADLDLYELSRLDPTRSELDTTERALAKIERASSDVAVRTRAAYLRAAYLRVLGRRDEAAREIGDLGFVRSVEVLGAFDNEDGKGFAEAYPPESSVDLAVAVPGAVLPVKWRRVDALPFAATIPLGDTVHPSQQAVAYAALWVTVPTSTAAVLRLSTDTPVAAWVDHAPVVREDRIRHFGLDNVTAPIALHGGANQILVKSGVKTGAWNLGIRITDGAGGPVPGAAVSLVPSRDPGAPTRAAAPPPAAAPPKDPRGAFASARWLVARGLCQPGLSALERLLTASGQSVLLRYFAADAAVQDHQTERALDLLTAAIRPADALPGFLRARAQIYVQKELWNQAQGDLTRAVASQPAARIARTDLADVLGRRGWEADRVRTLQEVIATWPDAEAAYVSLGAAREAQGHRALARRAYEQAIELEPGAAHPLRALRNLAERRDDAAAAERAFDALQAINPLDVNDQLARADFERGAGRLAEADALLRALSAQSPDHPTPDLRRAQIADELGRGAQAIALYQAAQDRDPRDAWLAERLQHLRPDSEDVLRRYTPTDEDIEAAVKRPSTKGDAASHVEVLLYDQATLLNADGSSRTTHTEVMRALSQKGRDELVRLALPTDGQVRVLAAFAQTPDGQRQEASSVDKTSVRFRNLEVGSTVVLRYAQYPRRGGALGDDFFSDWSFSLAGGRIDRIRWVIVAPKGKELHLDVDPRVKHVTSELASAQGAASIVHELTRENVPALPSEPSMIPFADLQAHVVVTTLPSWDSFIRWERAILDESFPSDPSLDALAIRLTQGATTPRDKLGKLFAFVAQEIRYQQEYESILAGWQPHRSSVVLERKYGDCKDKATLLIALARAVGVDLEFAVLATHRLGHPDRKVVFPKFNHAIVYVPAQPGIDEAFFTDPTVDALDLWNLREDDQGSAALVLNPTTGKWTWLDIPFQAPSYKQQRWKAEVDIESPEQVRAHSHLELRGGHASRLRTALRSEDQSRQVYDYLASQLFPGAKLVSASAPDHESFLHPLRIDQEIDASASIRQEGAHYRLKLPNDTDSAPTKLVERQTPLDLGPPTSDESEVVLHLGQGLKLVEMPAPVDVVDPCFHVTRKVSADHATVTVKEAFEETCTTVSVEDYPRYRAAMEHARSMLDTALVFDKAPAKK
ncbi:MAG TPA: transglutaminase domain-containing protein [Polyangiaceae bacterium]|jgi:tetratricopeptide (TPR) repeat protein